MCEFIRAELVLAFKLGHPEEYAKQYYRVVDALRRSEAGPLPFEIWEGLLGDEVFVEHYSWMR